MAPAGLARRGRSQGATSRAAAALQAAVAAAPRRRDTERIPWPPRAWPGVVAAEVRPAGQRPPSRRPWPPLRGGAARGAAFGRCVRALRGEIVARAA